MYYQNEWSANQKIQEVEAISHEAWKFTSVEKESVFQYAVRILGKSFETKRNQKEHGSCVACQL